MIDKIKKNKYTLLILAALLIISGVAHAYNMFHFPYFENDEGTYMSQAWSLITQGKLAPYTYWYDHAPAGWMLIASWVKLTGGFFTFGTSINSGRVLMLVLHLLITVLVFYVAKKISGDKLMPGIIAALIFSLSPLGIFFQRRVLLDNIMIFWVFIAFALLLKTKPKLSNMILSAIAFAIAVLTKESAVFLAPAFAYIVFSKSHNHHKTFAFVKWIAVFLSIVSFYFLYALLKGEIFPTGTFLGGTNVHVSLLGTIMYQSSRAGGFFLNQTSSFMINFREWLRGGFLIITPDPIIIIAGIISTIFVSLRSIRNVRYRYLAFLTLSYWFFLMRGTEVIGFYIVPLLPLLALCIGLTMIDISEIIKKGSFGIAIKFVVLVICLTPFVWYYSSHLDVYRRDQISNQLKAISWIKGNVSRNSIILIDNYAFVDLRTSFPGSVALDNKAHYYWKADKDPEIKEKLLKNNWRNVDYILSTPQVKYDAMHSGLNLVDAAYNNSTVVKNYPNNGWDLSIQKVEKENGKNLIAKSEKVESMSQCKYVVAGGDSLWAIAKKNLGEGKNYSKIMELNKNKESNFDLPTIHPNQELIIPCV